MTTLITYDLTTLYDLLTLYAAGVAPPFSDDPPGIISRDGQYLFNGLLMNDSQLGVDTLKVVSVDGLFNSPDMKTSDAEIQDDHGGSVGRDLFSSRTIVMDLTVIASTKANMYSKLETIAGVFQPQPDLLPLIYQRAGIGKRFVMVRPRKLGGFQSSWEVDHGVAVGSVMLLAPDPRKFAFNQRSQSVTIASGGITASGTLAMNGNFKGGSKPVIDILGPTINPRISNGADGGRSWKWDGTIIAGVTLTVDFNSRTVTMAGIDVSDGLRTDNQWWVLNPGDNFLTFTRTNTPANISTMTVKWWDSFA